MKFLKQTFMIALIALAPLSAAKAAAEGTASAFIEKLGNEALQVLGAQGADNSKFHHLLDENFDIPAIGRFVLGRGWNTATPEQQQEYLSLFNTLVHQIYTDRFSTYSGETFKLAGERPDGNDTTVTTQIVRTNGAPPVAVDWRVRKNDAGAFKIVDVIVEGVSMSVTQRSEFASVLQRNNGKMDALLDMLRKKTAGGTVATAK